MRWILGLAMLSVAGFCLPSALEASDARPWEALQPFDVANGIELGRVTYVAYWESGSFVAMTCWPNRVFDEGLRSAKNMNAAFEAKLKVRALQSGWPYHGDTLCAVLDASSLKAYKSVNDWPDTTLLAATIECVVVNAAWIGPVNFVKVDVEGPAKYRRYGGVFEAGPYRCGPVNAQYPLPRQVRKP